MCCEAQWKGDAVKEPQLKDASGLEQWFEGDYLSNIREKMLKGIPLPECTGCYIKEKKHKLSTRMSINNKFFSDKNNDPYEHSLKKIDVKLGNKCNLKCKMCFPYASSELWKEWKELGWNSDKKDPNNNTNWKYYDGYFKEDYAWPKNKTNIEKIKQSAVKCKQIVVTGGEPTINPEFYEILKYCIDLGVAKDISLIVTTNATKIHPRFFDLVKQFKYITLRISMDGTGKTYEYVRYPADYNKVFKNIERYNEFIKSLGGESTLKINFVLQVWNLHNAVDVITELSPMAVPAGHHNITIQELQEPRFMQWGMLPQDKVKKVIGRITEELKKDTDGTKSFALTNLLHIIKAYKKYVKKDYKKLKDQLIEFTTKQDSHRGISLEDYIPELVDFFK
jgi:molybdenum cofactor biosynthesis enzyme MoaA